MMYGRRLLLAATLVSMSACVSDSDPPLSTESLSVALPDRIRDVAAIDPAAVSAFVTINNSNRTPMRAVSGGYSAVVFVPIDAQVNVSVEYVENFESGPVTLASFNDSIDVGSQQARLLLRRSNLNFDRHDDDDDSVNNLTEREQGTDPQDNTDAPAMITLNVNAEQPAVVANAGFQQFFVEATVAGSSRGLQRSGDQYSGNFRVAAASAMNAQVQFIETVSGSSLVIAQQSRAVLSPSNQQTVTFSALGYDVTADHDSDGSNNLDEILAGHNPLVADGGQPLAAVNTLTIRFSVPAAIDNPNTVSAQLQVDGGQINITRQGNSFVGSVSVSSGSSVAVAVDVFDSFGNQSYRLAAAQQNVQVSSDGQQLNFDDGDFDLGLDDDQDGAANYIERQQGTNPFVESPQSVSCQIASLPQLSANAGAAAQLSAISGFIDCSGTPFALISPTSGFAWDAANDVIGWLLPGDVAGGEIINAQLQVVNPDNQGEVYQSATVQLLVEAGQCKLNPVELNLPPAEDAYVDGTEVVNQAQLRVDGVDRRSVLRFGIDPGVGNPDQATLNLTVSGDNGNGEITVFLLRDVNWSSTDGSLVLPALDQVVGVANASWLDGQSYDIGLSASALGVGDVTLVLQMAANSDDVAFAATESGNAIPALKLNFPGCP